MFKRIVLLLAVLAATALAVPVGHAQTPPPSYCVDGQSVTLPVPISAAQGSRDLTQGIADLIIATTGGPFFFGSIGGSLFFLITADEGVAQSILAPGYTAHTVTSGACKATFVHLDRNFWLCYSPNQVDPAVYSRSQAIANFQAGMTVPFAVREPLSNTRLASGLYLVCNLPAGYTPQGGVAVSTGGGEMYTGPLYPVSFMLAQMRLDYTTLGVRS